MSLRGSGTHLPTAIATFLVSENNDLARNLSSRTKFGLVPHQLRLGCSYDGYNLQWSS